jgi:hypothetical protein
MNRIAAIGLALSLAALLQAGCASTATPPAAAEPAATEEAARADIRETWGVEIESVRLTAADNMVDFRYRVVDPEKARPLMAKVVTAYLMDDASGAKFGVPTGKIGSLRQKSNTPRAGAVFAVIFNNPGRLVKKGSRVTVVIGDFKAEGLVVE